MDVYVDCNFQGSIPFKNLFRNLPDVNSVQVVSLFLENGEIRSRGDSALEEQQDSKTLLCFRFIRRDFDVS